MNESPIDINCPKLVDWLVQHRHCKKDWGEKLAIIRRKIRAALIDMPEHEGIKRLLENSRIDYFKCKQIVEVLEETEANTKNIFGFYSSQRMKDWKDIVCQYEKDCIYIAESATTLIREVKYEVPAIKKLIIKINKDIEELEKFQSNATKRAQQLNSEYARLAQTHNIKGVHIVEELIDQSKNLKPYCIQICESVESLSPALQYYKNLAASVSRNDTSELLSILNHMIVKGNTTVYEFRHKIKPDSIEPYNPVSMCLTVGKVADEEIDFGDDETPSSDSSSGFVHLKKTTDDESSTDDTFIRIEESGSPSAVCIAKNEEALPLLEHSKTRNMFVNSLCELEAFFAQIKLQNESKDTYTGSAIDFSGSSSTISKFSSAEIDRSLAIIRDILSKLTNEKNRALFLMNEFPLYIEEIDERFQLLKKQAAKFLIKAGEIDGQIYELQKQVKEAEVLLKKSMVAAKETQDKVESSLSSLYGSRPFNIMGCFHVK